MYDSEGNVRIEQSNISLGSRKTVITDNVFLPPDPYSVGYYCECTVPTLQMHAFRCALQYAKDPGEGGVPSVLVIPAP